MFSKNNNNSDFIDYIVYLIPTLLIVFIGISLMSCKSTVQIPVQTVEKVVYKDTLVYVHDSVFVEVPFEKVKESSPIMDTSYLKTSLAESIAYIDTANRKLFHTLEQKGEVRIVYDTIVKFSYIDKVIEKEVPVEVEIIKYKRDALFWWLLGWALFCLLLIGLKLFVIK